jgi:Uncharacterized protein containing SIS (Sugar ISomerase) phosphosugar binding domain
MNFVYFDEIQRILTEVREQEEQNLDQAVNLLCEAIKSKHSIFIFGASHAGILSEELFYRAGGLVVMNPIFGREIMLDTSPITKTSEMERLEGYGKVLAMKTPFKKDDLLIIHSVSGRNPVAIDLALEASKNGVKVIALTNVTYSKQVKSKHSSGKNLYEVSDLVIDNHGEQGDACVAIEGLPQKVAASSTVVGATILNSLVAACVERLVQNGMEIPPVFYSANIDGGDEKNRFIVEEYKDVIHYKF